MLQQSCRILQGYCSRYLFYFIANKSSHAIKNEMKLNKINALFYFIAAFILLFILFYFIYYLI